MGLGGQGDTSKIWNPSGVSLGTASGAIRIDTKDVDRARREIGRAASEMSSSFVGVDKAAKSTSRSFERVAKDINSMRGEIVALSTAAGVLAGIGLNVASNMEAAKIQFVGLTGGVQAATNLMNDLRKKSLATGIPFNDMLKASKLLLPTLQGNTDQLEQYMKLAQRVAVLNPAEGITGAAFAINEAISSGGTDLVSLAERFNISRSQLRDALAQTGATTGEIFNQ